MADVIKKINDYFDTVSREKFLKDAVKAGIKLYCWEHLDFNPILGGETSCDNCQELADLYRNPGRDGSTSTEGCPMELGTAVWTQGLIAHPKAPQGCLGPLTKGTFLGITKDGLARVWFGDKIGHIDIPVDKISEDNGR